jgi:hypothetical protein
VAEEVVLVYQHAMAPAEDQAVEGGQIKVAEERVLGVQEHPAKEMMAAMAEREQHFSGVLAAAAAARMELAARGATLAVVRVAVAAVADVSVQ